jgi:hypothetical protein
MTYALMFVCAVAATLQWAVLRDHSIMEPPHVCQLRRMRIVAHGMAAGYALYLIWTSYWLQLPLALALMLLALVDALAAVWRLWPELFDEYAPRRRRARSS